MPAGRQALDRIEQHYRDIAAGWREQGLPTAAANLERFLDGTGWTVRLSRDEATRFQWIRDAEAENNERFARRTFVGDSKDPSVKGLINLPADGSPVSFEDNWTRDLLMGGFLAGAAIGDRDFALAYGQAKLQSKGEFTARRQGSTIFILQRYRGAKPFRTEAEWQQRVRATVQYRNGRLFHPQVEWGRVSQ
jgi:hypothetical protein